jgi:WD40 repeat protein
MADEPVLYKGHEDTINFIEKYDDMLYTTSLDGTIRVWDVDDGRQLKCWQGHEDAITSMTFSSNALILQVGSKVKVVRDKMYTGSKDNTCRLWDLASGECTRIFKGHTQQIIACKAIAKEGTEREVLTASWDCRVNMYDIASSEVIRAFKSHTACIYDMHVHGGRMVTCSKDSTILVWEVDSGEVVHTLRGHGRASTRSSGSVYKLHVVSRPPTEGGDLLLSGGADCTARSWIINTGEQENVFEGHTGWVINLQVIARTLYTISFDKSCRSWDPFSGEPMFVYKGHHEHIISMTCVLLDDMPHDGEVKKNSVLLQKDDEQSR